MKHYQHVIWDWNGTLFDDVTFSVGIINTLLRKRELPDIDRSSYRTLFTFPVKGYYEKLGFDFDRECWKTVADEFMTHYFAGWAQCCLCPGAKERLAQFRGCGIGQSILSAYVLPALQEAVDWFGLTDYFLHVAGLDNHLAESKIEIGRRLLEQLSLPNGAIVMVGDTTHDYEVASALGIDCVLITNGHNDTTRLQQCGVPVYTSLADSSFRL